MLTKQALEYLKLGTGGSYSLARDAIAHRLFDVRSFGSVASDYTFFSQPVGAPWLAASLKTLNETNLYDTAKLPNGQTFLVNRFGVALVGMTAAALDAVLPALMISFHNILSSSVFEIRLAGREYDFQIHGRDLLPMPISGNGIIATSNARVGDMIASGWVKLDPTPIFLDQLVSFSVVHRLGNPVGTLQTILNASSTALGAYYAQMRVVLEGFLTRAK